jgi:hypothetical protein
MLHQNGLGRVYPALAGAQFAGRRVHPASGLTRLRPPANPVLLQAEHLTSVDTSSDFNLATAVTSWNDANSFHVVVQYGLPTAIVPLQGHP